MRWHQTKGNVLSCKVINYLQIGVSYCNISGSLLMLVLSFRLVEETVSDSFRVTAINCYNCSRQCQIQV